MKRKESDLIASIDPDILGDVIKALKPMFEEVDERSAIVMDIPNVIKAMLKDVQKKLETDLRKGKTEVANNIGRLVGLKITTKGQSKNKAFMYDLEKGFKSKRWKHLKK